jgi:hypothetical protein
MGDQGKTKSKLSFEVHPQPSYNSLQWMVPWWVLIHSGLHIMIWQMPVFVWLFNSLKEPLILVFLVFQIQKMSVPVLWKKS